MAIYHIRVCAVGTEEEMCSLMRIMLQNMGETESVSDGLEPMKKRSDLLESIHHLCSLQGGMDNGFLYDMICPRPFGEAVPASTEFDVSQTPSGEWTACFSYQSNAMLQQQDWLWLHERCGRLQMAAQYACEDFSREKGRVLIADGKVLDNWNCMAQTWFWLIKQYTCGETPEGILDELQETQRAMQEDEYDMTIEELLCSCEQNLRLLDEATSQPEKLREEIDNAREHGEWGKLLSCRLMIAQNLLWKTENTPKWLACLEAARQVWNDRLYYSGNKIAIITP